jgi:hypothetical protein
VAYNEAAIALHEVVELKRTVEALQIELGAIKRRLEVIEDGRRETHTANPQ